MPCSCLAAAADAEAANAARSELAVARWRGESDARGDGQASSSALTNPSSEYAGEWRLEPARRMAG
jgi:hypothetical protein